MIVKLCRKNYLGDLLPFFNVVCLDCAGSGISEGGVVTLGYYEKEDLRVVIEYLKEEYQFSRFILWGRSMGAVTSLLYAAKYRDVVAVVADNAFSDL
jgi:pimeloyl-ACP methyl ester carboxylesterase